MVQVPDSEDKLDRVSVVCPSGFVIAHIDDSSKDKEEEMSLNLRKGLKDLLAGRSEPKDVPGTQPLPDLPLPPTTGLLPIPNLKKKRKEKKTEEGEIVPLKYPKQQKIARDRGWASSVDNKEAEHSADVRHPTWNPKLELDGAALPWNSSIREFQRGHSYHVAKALERPLLLPKDMDALKHMRQLEFFLSLKRDLAMVSSSTLFINSDSLSFLFGFLLLFFFFF